MTSRRIVECLNNRSFTLSDLRLNGSLTALKTLRLKGTSVSSLESGQFDAYPLLSYLSLRDTQLKSIHPDAFDGLKWVRQLDLSFNENISLPAGVFSNLHKLEYLNLPKHVAHERCSFGINPLESSIYSDSGSRTVQVFADDEELSDHDCFCHPQKCSAVDLFSANFILHSAGSSLVPRLWITIATVAMASASAHYLAEC
jgi:hypothetical protein